MTKLRWFGLVVGSVAMGVAAFGVVRARDGGGAEPGPAAASPRRVDLRRTAAAAAGPAGARVESVAAPAVPAPAVASGAAGAAPVLPAIGAARRIGLDEAAATLQQTLAEVKDLRDIGRLVRLLRDDPEMVARLRATAEAWMRSDLPDERVRGLLLLAGLDPAAGFVPWRTALANDGAAEARAALAANPPLAGTPAQDAPYVDTLLATLDGARDERVRAAALQGLPAALAPEDHDRLALALLRETAPAVRAAGTLLLARTRSDRPAVIDVLTRIGFGAREDTGTRIQALRGLAKLERAHPGALSEESLRQVQALLKELEG